MAGDDMGKDKDPDDKNGSDLSRKIALEKSLDAFRKKEPNALAHQEPSGSALSRLSPLDRSSPSRQTEESCLWLVTFTDTMALMLTFFVLLYAMSEPHEAEWKEITSGLSRYMGTYQSPEWYEGPQDEIDIAKLDFSKALELGYLRSIISDVVSRNEALHGVLLIPQADHLVISLPEALLFASGKADVFPEGRRALFAIGGSLANIRNRIEITGHADPRPIDAGPGVGAGAIESNWELSLRRAMSVADILRDVGYDRPIITRGLSSARYDELPAEWNEEKRLDMSRRVDILIMQDDGTQRGFMMLDKAR